MKPAAVLSTALLLASCASGPQAPQKKAEEKKAVEIFRVDPATAAQLSGKVTFTGKRPPRKKINIDEDEQCVKLNKSGLFDDAILVNSNGTLRNVFIYVKSGLEGKHFERPAEPVILEQRACQFTPRVLAVRAGQTFRVTNADPVTHNVHPIAKMNREWNQSQGPSDPPIERKFARPEIMVRIKCNVHSWMRSWAAVMDHPYFAISDPEGNFAIPNLPPGDYTIEAWHEKLGTAEQKLHLTVGQKAEMSFSFSFSGDSQ